ncbi:hypothetical protein AMJ49_01260 [Parcubacteria bacterium DG_74_2]|nr:MAG: hypothetical protein AMJ49_01260 [Parcubacteria bacterium DG_74_2]
MNSVTEKPFFMFLILPLIFLWTLVWKGIALWKAARNGHKKWFGVLLFINTLGILEIIYVFIFSKKKSEKESEELKNE